MATYTTYLNGQVIANASGGNAAGFPGSNFLVGDFDASKRNCVAADIVQLINVPAGTYVKNVFVRVLNGDATQTLNVGDGTDPDGYVAAADVATTGNIAKGAGLLATGKLYSADDTIDLEVPATKAFDTLKVRVIAEVSTF